MPEITVLEASEILAVTPNRVRQFYRAGRISGRRAGPRILLIEKNSLKNVKNRKQGWPKGRSRKELQKS